MANIIGYMAHDVLGNCEGQVDDFSDPSVLAEAEAAGVVFVAVYDDGTRAIVKAADVTEPQPRVNGVTLVAPKYVDQRIAATTAVFDALLAIVDPESAVVTADETGEASGEQADPVEAFKEAIASLKSIAEGEGD